jgi:hypothetical protein
VSNPRRTQPQILLSFDVEEFDIPEEYGCGIALHEQLRVSVEGLDALLDLLDRLQIPATFFVTANFAQHYPERIKAMAKKHEIASHGFYHASFHEKDLKTSRLLLRRLTGQSIDGFRMAKMQPVAASAVAQAGYQYNSSMNPTYIPGRYNNFWQPRLPHRHTGILQIPISVTPLIRIPLFWLSFKNFPLWMYKMLSAWTLHTDRQLNLYFHPWEFNRIENYHLPKYICYPCGKPLLYRLETYLRWLKTQGKFRTFSEFTGEIHQYPDEINRKFYPSSFARSKS